MVLEIENIEKQYEQGSRKTQTLSSVNLTMQSGDFVSIVGKSGSGKSTLLHQIAGILRPTKGTIRLDGKEIIHFSDKEASTYRNQEIGYVLQGQTPLSTLTVMENVKLPYYLSGKKENLDALAARTLLEDLHIEDLADAYPKELSGGELKRLSIARALMNSPKLLLLDEPTSDLDSYHTKVVMELIQRKAKEGTGVLMVTHDINTTEYGDALYQMEEGRLKAIWKS